MAKTKSPAGNRPTPTRPPPGLDADKHAKAQRAAHKGGLIRERLFAAFLATGVGSQAFDPADFQAYLDGLLRDLGDPADPLQRMLLEQLAFAHLRLARLHAQATAAASTEAVKVYNAACARLLGEVRRTALTLNELRGKAPAAPRLKLAQTG